MASTWTTEQILYLEKHYSDYKSQEIANKLDKPISSIYNKAHSLGLKKSETFLKSEACGRLNGKQGASTRFKKGLVPWNKGKKFTAGGKSVKTQFKKGNKPHNYLPIGSTRISKDGYLEVKTADPRTWEFAHRVEYERLFGSIPEGVIISFKDGDKMNLAPENLEPIERAEAVRRTRNTEGYAAYLIESDVEKRQVLIDHHPELIQVKQLQLKLNEKISDHEQ